MNNINPALEKYTELIIKKIEDVEANDWSKPWFTSTFAGSPRNLSGKVYHNLNKALLYAVCDANKYITPIFLTFNQAQQEGILILKGAKSFPIIFYDLNIKDAVTGVRISREFYNSLSPKDQNRYKVIPIQKFYNVFNIDQTNFSEKHSIRWEAIKKQFTVDFKSIDSPEYYYTNQLLDKTINEQTWLCPIEFKQQNSAFYSTTEDKITLPTMQQFPKGTDFYFTALHEMAHSTGHSKRLNRPYGSRLFEIEKYAKEELIAELSSAVIGKDLGLSTLPRKENAQYLKSWLLGLKENPKYLMSILQDVSKATTMIESTIGLENSSTLSTSGKGDNSLCKNVSLEKCIYSSDINELCHSENATSTILNRDIQTSGCKTLIGDITISQVDSKATISLENLQIKDKSTGLTEPLKTNGIDLSKQPADAVKKLLSGNKVQTSSGGITQMLGLSKTPLGWGITIGKQVFNSADSSASIG